MNAKSILSDQGASGKKMARHLNHVETVAIAEFLDSYTVDEAAWNNLIITRMANVPVQFGTLGQFTISLETFPPEEVTACEIDLTIDGERVVLRLCDAFQKLLLHAQLGATGHGSWLDDQKLAALVLEHCLTELIARFEVAHGFKIAVNSFHDGVKDSSDSSGLRFGITVSHPGRADLLFCGIEACSAAVAAKLMMVIGKLPASQPTSLNNFTHTCVLRSPNFQLDYASLRQLAPGNGLVLDPRWDPKDELYLSLSGTHQVFLFTSNRVECDLDADGYASLPRRGINLDTQMSTQNQKSVSIDDIPVVLSLELDRFELSFGEVAELLEGSMIQLKISRPEQLGVMVNGQNFGTAELIRIGSGFGIRILSVNSAGVRA